MNSPDDVHRSLRRYVSLVLTEPWKVRTERQPVADEERPVAVIEPSSPTSLGSRRRVTIPQGDLERLQGFSVMAYPALGATAREGRLDAQQIAALLERSFIRGLVEVVGAASKNIGGPFRVPVYDYDGVPVTGPGRAGPVDPYGYAWIEDVTARPLQDPVDYLRWSVVCELRLSWEEAGRESPSASIATAMPGTFTP